MNCQFEDGECVRCGIRRDPPYPFRHCRPGLGDVVASGLSAIGITKQRAKAAAALVGFKDCGCDERRRKLNALGQLIEGGE